MCPAPRPESGAHTQGGFSRRPGSEGCRSAVSSPWFLFCTESTKWKRKPPPGAPAAGCQGRSHLPTADVRPQGRRERVWCGRARVRAHPSVRPARTAVAASACPVASASPCFVFGGCGEGGRGRCLEEGERGGKEARERQFFLSVWFQHPTTSGLDFWAPHSSWRPRRPGVRPLLAQPPANPWPLSKHAEADATRAPPPQACRSASPRPGARTVRSLTSSHSPMALLSRAKG